MHTTCKCGATLQRRNYVYVETVAGETVLCRSGYVEVCVKCGARLSAEGSATQTRLHALATKFGRGIAQKEDFRTARSLLGWRQVDLAEAMGMAPETISRIETGSIVSSLLQRKAFATIIRQKLMDEGGQPFHAGNEGEADDQESQEDADVA